MDTTAPPTRRRLPRSDDFTRTGAVWVTATGAFLLVVAAAIFVAVRWDQLPEAIKLAVLGALSGSALLAGRKLRGRLPATGAVLYHLGAFLLPVVAAAVALRFDPSWGALLLVEGLTGAVLFAGLERIERSVVLRAAAALAVVVAAVGLGTTAGVPPALTVSMAAAAAAWAGRARLARAWALLAGLAPAAALAGPWLASSTVLDDVALTSSDGRRVALVSGAISATVLLVDARRNRDVALLVAALASLSLGAANAWIDVQPPTQSGWLVAAAVFLTAEVGAWLLARDPFLRRPARALAGAAEIAAALVAAPFALVVLVLPHATFDTLVPVGDERVLLAAITAAVAWLLADVRRRVPDATPMGLAVLVGSGWSPTAPALTATVVAGVAFGTASATATAIALSALAVVLVVSARPYAHLLAGWCAVVAVIVADETAWLAAATAVVGSWALTAAALWRARSIPGLGKVSPAHPPYLSTADVDVAVAVTWAVAVGAIVPLAVAAPVVATSVEELAVFGAWIALCWGVALVLDRAPAIAPTRHLGLVGRVAALGVVPVAVDTGAEQAAIVAGVIALLSGLDAVRRRSVVDAYVGAVAAPVSVAAGAVALGGTTETAAVAVAVAALLDSAATALVLGRGRRPLLAGAVWCAALALPLGATDAQVFATVLLLLGGAVLVGATVYRSALAAVGGAAVTCLGVWAHLDAAEVEATDAYVAPVAVALLVAGGLAKRRNGVGSWTAYGPAIGLLGAAALAERFAGGSGVHALVAGAVGTAAVIAGGWRRLAAPLLLGTAVLGAVVVSETLAYTATFPTWAWLAASGAVLVAAGIAMERAEVGPLETGRRVVDVVRDRFA